MQYTRERVGTLVTMLRERHGLTQQDLARRLGVSQSHISRIESGDRVIHSAMLDQLRLIFGVDEIAFFDRAHAEQIESAALSPLPAAQ